MERMFTRFDNSFTELKSTLKEDMGRVQKQLIKHQGQIDQGSRRMEEIDKQVSYLTKELAIAKTESALQTEDFNQRFADKEEMGKRLADIEAKTAILMAEQMAAQKDIEVLKRTPVAAPAGGTGPTAPRGPRWALTPRDQRNIFVITCLGWNLRD
eukprot:4206947-Pyramimonas_sp.AAC.1